MTAPAEQDPSEPPAGPEPETYRGPGHPAIPVSRVPQRHTARYLQVDGDLLTDAGPVPGQLIEVEAVWTPRGWVLEDWVGTVAVAPREESAFSETGVEGTARTSTDTSTDDASAAELAESASASTEEVMRLAANVMTSGRAVTAGLNGSRGDNRTLFADPVASLAQAVTGAFQLGYSSSTSTENAQYSGELAKGLRTAMERVSRQLRSTRARTSSSGTSRLLDQRRLRVLRNPSAERTLNLAAFSVSRQWSVATRESGRAGVVLVEIDGLADDFEERDVFVHRAVLCGVLLEPRLNAALENVARQYRGEPVLHPPHAVRVEGTATFSDPAESGARVSIGLRRWRNDRAEGAGRTTLPTAHRGVAHPFEIDVGGTRAADGYELVLDLDASMFDRRAVVSHLRLTAVLSDGSLRAVHDQEHDILLLHGETRTVPLPRMPTAAPSGSVELERLLDHLNANRPYYRLAIDLQRDAVSRFVRFRERGLEPPVDMNPVGVAGAHLAFLSRDEATPRRTTAEPDPDVMICTPTDGVFLEAVGGASTIGAHDGPWPVLPVADGGFAWPSPAEAPAAPVPAPVGTGLDAASASAEGRPEVPASELATKADVKGLLDSMNTLVTGLVGAAGGTAPAGETPGAAASCGRGGSAGGSGGAAPGGGSGGSAAAGGSGSGGSTSGGSTSSRGGTGPDGPRS